MISVIAIGGEVFGRCVEKIDVLAVVEQEEDWLCCGRKYLRFSGVKKRINICREGGRWSQVSDTVLRRLGMCRSTKPLRWEG